MRTIRHTLRRGSDARHLSAAIAKLEAAERERVKELHPPLPGRPLCGPMDSLGHAVHRAVTENA